MFEHQSKKVNDFSIVSPSKRQNRAITPTKI